GRLGKECSIMAETRADFTKRTNGPRSRRAKPDLPGPHLAAEDVAPAPPHEDVPFGQGILDDLPADAPGRSDSPRPEVDEPAPPSEAAPPSKREPLVLTDDLPSESAAVRETEAEPAPAADERAPASRRRPHHTDADSDGPRGFDQETNERYEEIKR